MSYFNTEHSHLYTKSLTRSSFSHFNSSNSQRPQVTLQERNNAFKIVLFVFFLGLGYFFFTVSLDLSWIMLFYLEWQIFCSLPLPTELLGNVLIARRFPFPMQLWTADSSFKQPAPKCNLLHSKNKSQTEYSRHCLNIRLKSVFMRQQDTAVPHPSPSGQK